MKAFVPYSYYLCWTPLNLHYYGIEFKKTAHPSNLWVSYFSSSKLVKYTRAYHGKHWIQKRTGIRYNKEVAI